MFFLVFTKSWNINENSQPWMVRDRPLRKFICVLTKWRIVTLKTQFSTWTAFMTMLMFYKKRLRCHSESKIQRYFSPATIAGLLKRNAFFCACCCFCIKCCSAIFLTTNDVKGLLYLMCLLFFCFNNVFIFMINICSIVKH